MSRGRRWIPECPVRKPVGITTKNGADGTMRYSDVDQIDGCWAQIEPLFAEAMDIYYVSFRRSRSPRPQADPFDTTY
jgi:hypothetical protein